MTKKDYELIAGAVAQTVLDYDIGSCEQTDSPMEVLRNVASYPAMDLKNNNPRFDHNKFLTACGIKIEQ